MFSCPVTHCRTQLKGALGASLVEQLELQQQELMETTHGAFAELWKPAPSGERAFDKWQAGYEVCLPAPAARDLP
jgi:hypothetical protein